MEISHFQSSDEKVNLATMHDALCERHTLSCDNDDTADSNDSQRVDDAGRRHVVGGGGGKHAGQRPLQFDDFVLIRCGTDM